MGFKFEFYTFQTIQYDIALIYLPKNICQRPDIDHGLREAEADPELLQPARGRPRV